MVLPVFVFAVWTNEVYTVGWRYERRSWIMMTVMLCVFTYLMIRDNLTLLNINFQIFLGLEFFELGIFIFYFGDWDRQLTLSSSNQSYLLWRKMWQFFNIVAIFLLCVGDFQKKQICQPSPVETWNQKWVSVSAKGNWLFLEKCAAIWRK